MPSGQLQQTESRLLSLRVNSVCEKHFKDSEVLRNSTFYNEKTGTISAPMKWPKLKGNAVPSIFPGSPSYISSSSAIRESPSKKRQ
ncbi:hypothetical protein AVEN_202152-1 [Araneus ventricosus]|uniref:THAP-type domain-containing protein n=1 Tax=Araneus ventricosus TaxID=182803 RepID=A0A4Y2E1P4_ARAVE|nr:hypothetical protein AVEN_202152-1 [Araneus ventricosus]